MGGAIMSSPGIEQKAEPRSTIGNTSLLEKLNTSVIWAKVTKWEFWPFAVLYFPVVVYWIWMTLRSRSFFFFTAANPKMHFGGMLGGSKTEILDLIPGEYLPKTFKISKNITLDAIKAKLKIEGLELPIIVKPDIGERGWMVELIKSEEDLRIYLNTIKVDFLVQEHINFPVELGIFYYRYPDQSRGTVSSIVMKEMLAVTGDGIHPVKELMKKNVRAKMHIDTLRRKNGPLMNYLPKRGEKVEVVSIGNHCRGTMFMNGNHLITGPLISVIDHISRQIEGFHFGRYDLRCTSIDDLCEGRNIKILELNGAGAEPAHIYQPGYPLIRAYRDIIHHLRALVEISIRNKNAGIPYMGFWQGVEELMKIRKYNRQKVN